MNTILVDAADLINLGIFSGGLIIALVCLIISARASYMDDWSRRFFLSFFTVLTLCVISGTVTHISTEFIANCNPIISKSALYLESLFSSMLMPMIAALLLHLSGEDFHKNRLLWIVNALWFVYFVLLFITQLTDYIYYYTPDNVYHRGPYYSVLLIPPALIMIVIFATLLRSRSKLSERSYFSFMIYILVPLACIIIQMKFYGIWIIVFGTCAASLFMFVRILEEEMDSYVSQQKENASLRTGNAVLQMRPHFIYNTMMSIYYLCSQDPLKAQQVILDFSKYLRGNFTAVAREGTIPFTEELEHTRAYLAVEEVRFEDMLTVHIDAPHITFHLPPLTMQPVVENCIKHGIDPDTNPLNIFIKTRKTETGSEITIEDTGIGLTATEKNSEPHIALDNIRKRLTLTCRGTLQIQPRQQGGTKVTIFIPDM